MRSCVLKLAGLVGLMAVTLLVLASCPVDRPQEIGLYATTGPPPARTARFIEEIPDRPVIELSRGVVLGIRCWDSCDGACVRPDFTAADPTMIKVLPTYRAGAASDGFVLTALKDGVTTLVVADACARQSYFVRVLKE